MLLHRPFFLLATVILLLASLFTATTAADNATLITSDGDPVIKTLPYKIDFDKSMPQNWSGQATIEVYMLSDTGKPSDSINSMGDNIGSKAYGVVYEGLSYLCPDTVGNDGNWCLTDREFWAPSLIKLSESGPTKSQIYIAAFYGYYKSNQKRNLLIGAIAGAYEAATNRPHNCWNPYPFILYGDTTKWCHAPVQIAAYTEDSQMQVTVSPFSQYGGGDTKLSFQCCETREYVDGKLKPLLDELKSVYPTTRGKDHNVGCSLACSDRQRDAYDFFSVDEVLQDVIMRGI